MMETFQDRGA